MMQDLFKKKKETFVFYMADGERVERETEIRFDPLTGATSRLLVDPGLGLSIPDYTELSEQTSGKNCPFCPENVYQLTPVFPEEIAKDGRITYGEAVVTPNLFPYSKHTGVVIMSKAHYLRLEDFSVKTIKNAFIAAQEYIKNVLDHDPHESFISINWNYLPQSGGSILHPHLQVVVSETPTNEQHTTDLYNQSFLAEYDEHYLERLSKYEKQKNERWIGDNGQVAWMHAFAPKSHNDYLAVFRERSRIDDFTEKDWDDFAQGLTHIFSALTEQNMASFNMNFSLSNDDAPAYARLIPRITLGATNTSDVNFFQAMHDEPLSYKTPEENAELARKYF